MAISGNNFKLVSYFSKKAEKRVMEHLVNKFPQKQYATRDTKEEQESGDISCISDGYNLEVKTTGHLPLYGKWCMEEIQNSRKAEASGIKDGWVYLCKADKLLVYCPNYEHDLLVNFKELREWYEVNKDRYELYKGTSMGTDSQYRLVPMKDLLEVPTAKKVMVNGREQDSQQWTDWAKKRIKTAPTE